jgi:hypothetical protein
MIVSLVLSVPGEINLFPESRDGHFFVVLHLCGVVWYAQCSTT